VIPESNHVEPEYHLLTKRVTDQNGSNLLPMVSFHVKEVSIPPYLDDNRLVHRASRSTIKYLENHRWGEPLGEGVSRVVGLNLSGTFGTLSYSAYPHRPKNGCHYELGISLERFEATGQNNVTIEAIIDVFYKSKPMTSFNFNKTIFTTEKNAHRETEALSDLLSLLSSEIAKRVKSLPLSQVLRIKCGELTFNEMSLNKSLDIVKGFLADHSDSDVKFSVYSENSKVLPESSTFSHQCNDEYLFDIISMIGEQFSASVHFTSSGIIFSPVH
jgi:uncharacterized lipoprotein YmbA